MEYTELQVTSNFSFLRGGSHPDELTDYAAALGYDSIGLTDRNTLAGVVRAHMAAKAKGIRLITGCRLDLQDAPSLLAYPTDQEAYSSLSGLLSKGNLRTEKGNCLLYKADVFELKEKFKWVLLPPTTLTEDFDFDPSFKASLKEFREALGRDLYLAASRSYQGDDQKKLFRLAQLARIYDTPMVATNDVHYHNHQRRELQDILTCVREKCTIHTAGFLLHANAERYLKPIAEMKRLFRQYPDALARSREIAEACLFSLDSLKYVYPEEITSDGRSTQEELTMLAWQGARERYGYRIPAKIVHNIEYELRFIEEMNYAAYFLTVYDIVRFARSQKILCQGRGSAANSTICYCLGITAVDPSKFDLLFERFISSARNEPPDIDVDFEHERREEVIQYIYNKYGRNRSAIVATVTQLRQKGAIRDVGKAMGLSVDMVGRLSSAISEYGSAWVEGAAMDQEGFDRNDPQLKKVLELTRQLVGFPRQLGQHTGGFVITQGRITDLCPILNARMQDRTNIEWNKDDIDALGFLKIDVLGLGMLTCIRKGFDLLRAHHQVDHNLASVPQDDPLVYEMIGRADTIGVFQIESRAQQSMLPRMKPTTFYDLVIEVAIVRPGPIQGDMVHPYLRRRNGEEPVTFPSKELEEILGKTLGVPLFQEQAMKIAIVAAGFSPAEADALRRSMASFRAPGQIIRFHEKMIRGMTERGYSEEYATRIFKQLEGFGSYGFPESHAASFALLVYISAWTKCYYPDVFACALLNSLPMGFYQPAQIVIDARKHGVEVRPVDINHSSWDNTLEEKSGRYCILRLGFRQVKGLREDDMKMLLTARGEGYSSLTSLRDAGVPQAAIERLADADAFRSIGLDRRQALWEASALQDRPIGLYSGLASESASETPAALPLMSDSEQVVQDYAAISLSLKAHPVSFLREKLDRLHIVAADQLANIADGSAVKIAGLVLVRQRPSTAKGVCFITLEDETGVCNIVVFENLFKKYRREIIQSKLLMIEGRLQREGEVIHVITKSCHNFSSLLYKLVPNASQLPALETVSRADEKTDPALMQNRKATAFQQPKLFPDGRNFK